MKNLQLVYSKKSIARLVIFLLVINSFMFADAWFNQSSAAPVINEMNINTTDNEVSVYGTGDGNGAALAEKPFRYTIGSSQSDWVRDSSNMTITDTLTAGTLSNTCVVNNGLQLSTTGGILSGFTYKSVITIDHTKIDTNLTNFPLTVYLNNSNFDFTKAKSNGDDIRFTDANLNPLKFEREEHSAANAKAVYNVLIPTVSNTEDTQIYMWYGNSNAYNTSIEAWQDKTGKQLTYNGNVKLVTGIQSGKRVASFDGSGDYFTLNGESDYAFGTGDFCIEFYYKTNVDGTQQTLFDGHPAHINGYYLRITKNPSNYLEFFTNNSTRIAGTTPLVLGTVYHIALIKYNGITKLYLNGVQEGNAYTDSNTCLCGTSRPVIGIGGWDVTSYPLNGYIYGLRVTKGNARYYSNFTPPSIFEIDGANVVFCTNFDTIYDQNYAMVQHMGDSLVDATGNGNNGTATGTTVVNTDYSKARSFNGTSDFISFPDSFRDLQYTLITGLDMASLPNANTVICYSNSSSYCGYKLGLGTEVAQDFGMRIAGTNGGALKTVITSSTLDPFVAAVKMHSTEGLKLFKDGIIADSDSYTATVFDSTMNLYVGKTATSQNYYQGTIRDMRVSNIGRSDAWIKAESLSLKNSIVTYSVPYLQYFPSGTRESGVYDISGYVSSSRVQWTEDKPAGTNIVVETNVSVDGGSSWLGWRTCTNGDSIADLTSANSSNARLKLRQTLSTSNGSVTPSLSNSVITINFSKYIHRLATQPNKKYTVKFEIKDVNGATTSSIRDVYTKAQAPLFTISGATDHSVDLLFSDTNPAPTEYQIMCDSSYVNSSGVLTSVPTWITLKNKTITILGLNIGTAYNFVAKARNGAEEETNISGISAATQGVPVPTGSAILAATAQNNSVTLGWNEIPNSLSYELEMDGVIKNVGLNMSYIHKGLMTNTQHIYRVRGRNQEGFSDWSNLVTVITTNNLPLIPTNLVAKASKDSVTVYWTSAQDALTYTVEINGTEITDVKKNSASLFGLDPETVYTYKVKACNLAGESEWSDTGTITTTYLNTPKISFKEKDSNQLTIGWGKIEGATSYQIALDANENFRTLYHSDLEEFATDSSITFIHDNLPTKTAHVYRVRAVCTDGVSAWSDAITLETLTQRPDVPTNFKGKCSDNFITLTWNAIEEAIGYDLEVDGVVIENDNTPQYQYKGLDQYTEHTYRVRSVTKEIQSYWSNLLRLWTSGGVPDEPKNVVISNSRGIATLDWDPTPGAQNYDIEAGGTIYSISEDTFVYNNINLIASSSSIYKETAYRLRAGNDVGKSDWTGYYVNNAIMAKVEKGKEIDLGLTASNIMYFSRYTLYVNYNDKALTVTDLCAYSVVKELGPSMVEGHDIEIVSFSPGHIVFRVNKIINEGYLWTGIINNIKFVGNATGGSTITYTAQCSKD